MLCLPPGIINVRKQRVVLGEEEGSQTAKFPSLELVGVGVLLLLFLLLNLTLKSILFCVKHGRNKL